MERTTWSTFFAEPAMLVAIGFGRDRIGTMIAATQARIAAREVVSLESGDSFGYDCGVKSDNWEIPGASGPDKWPM